MPNTPTPGQIAYEAYVLALLNTPPAGSLRWQELEARIRDAWDVAAAAVLALQQAGVDDTGFAPPGTYRTQRSP
jgi:hypothetical protein